MDDFLGIKVSGGGNPGKLRELYAQQMKSAEVIKYGKVEGDTRMLKWVGIAVAVAAVAAIAVTVGVVVYKRRENHPA